MATTWAVLLPSRGPAAPDTLAAVLPLGAFLGAVAFLLASPLVGAPLAACAPRLAARAPSVAFGSVFGFAGWRTDGRADGRTALLGHRLAEHLDARPYPADGRLAVRELLDRRDARQAVPNRQEPLAGPLVGQIRQLLLAGEGIERGCGCCGGLLLGGERADVVVVVDGERFHLGPFLARGCRDAHIHHSCGPDRQGKSDRS